MHAVEIVDRLRAGDLAHRQVSGPSARYIRGACGGAPVDAATRCVQLEPIVQRAAMAQSINEAWAIGRGADGRGDHLRAVRPAFPRRAEVGSRGQMRRASMPSRPRFRGAREHLRIRPCARSGQPGRPSSAVTRDREIITIDVERDVQIFRMQPRLRGITEARRFVGRQDHPAHGVRIARAARPEDCANATRIARPRRFARARSCPSRPA